MWSAKSGRVAGRVLWCGFEALRPVSGGLTRSVFAQVGQPKAQTHQHGKSCRVLRAPVQLPTDPKQAAQVQQLTGQAPQTMVQQLIQPCRYTFAGT
jgi:hypothetical protein